MKKRSSLAFTFVFVLPISIFMTGLLQVGCATDVSTVPLPPGEGARETAENQESDGQLQSAGPEEENLSSPETAGLTANYRWVFETAEWCDDFCPGGENCCYFNSCPRRPEGKLCSQPGRQCIEVYPGGGTFSIYWCLLSV